MKIFGGILLIIPFIVYLVVIIIRGVVFDKDCEGYLKRAADANTVEQASIQLKIAIDYMETNGLTSGYTSVIYNTPDEDVGFWYTNIKNAQAELAKVTDLTTALEKSNLLMKLRETLLDGTSITCPKGISVFPHNVAFMFWGWLSFIVGFAGVIIVMVGIEDL